MKIKFLSVLLCLLLVLAGCGRNQVNNTISENNGFPNHIGNPEHTNGTNNDPSMPEPPYGPEDDDSSFGDNLEDTGAYDGYFEGDSYNVSIECISGTPNAYKIEGNTLTFTAVSTESVYSLKGTLSGNIIIDTGDDHKFELELQGFSLVCSNTNPITVKSGDEITIKATKDTDNYIYDMRSAIDTSDESLYSAAIHSLVDLEIGGKGKLTVVSENNKGIHTKDDLQLKNLTLFVSCKDNALKGNDSVKIESGTTTLIATSGDCIKTSNTDVSEKGNQRGTVSILGGSHTLYAACDGIDAAYNLIIDGDTTILNIYTDKFSNYSEEVSAASSDSNYIRFTSDKYYYSVKYYNSESDFVWINAEYHSRVSGGRSNYYYYSYPKMTQYAKQQFFIYESESHLGSDTEYLLTSELLSVNTECDTFALTNRGNQVSYTWTNYTTNIQEGGFGGHGGPGGGPGGMGDGNSDKGDHSTKGIKAANEIVINSGTVNIKSYDDAIHVNNDSILENGETSLGNLTVNGGTVTIYSCDDGLHADGTLSITSGTVRILSSYEGLEGNIINISGGNISVNSKDDGINATTSSDTAVSISGGTIYVYCSGDGIDSNSRISYSGILFSGGNTVIISTSSGNSAIDTEQGYAYTAGSVIAIMPRRGMSNEATHCKDFTSIGKQIQISLSQGSYLTVDIGSTSMTMKIPVSLSALVVTLGDSSPSISVDSDSSLPLDENGISWN